VTFTHKINGQKCHGINDSSVKVVSGKTVARPEKDPTCSEPGHVFVNWYTDDSYTELFDFSKPITENTTVVGRWSYQVQFTVDGQLTFDQELNPVQVNYGDTVLSVVPDINNVTAGNGDYKITGWKIRNGYGYGYGYGTTNIDINTYKVSSNITLIANVEKVKKYDVTYFNGTEKVFTDSAVAGKTYSIPEDKTLTSTDTHKTFLGWYTNPACTEEYKATAITKNLNLYAGWKTEYTVKFDANGKTFTTAISGQKVESGTRITLPTNVTETTGKYDFIGWLVNGTAVSGSYKVESDVEFVANWKDKTVYHTVTFVAREGNNETQERHGFKDYPIQVEHGKLIDPSQIPEDPTCRVSNHEFYGWYTSIDLSTPFDFKTMTITEDIKIYSGWFTDTTVELDAKNAKKSYTQGDTLDLTNVKILIKQKRVNGNYVVTSEIPVKADMVTNLDTVTKSAGNNKKVEVKYNGKTYSYTINVARKFIDGSITLTDTAITKTYGTAPFAIGYKDATGDVSFESNNSKVA
ncbi:MAG: InlB B-repeat-containing protein, partial [Lachnospiraceae bacterium]|nr:InlB B-repeat-containing protein [Lachnospiraceae bacterium]